MQRLSPLLSIEDRSAEFGFLPDPLWPHLGYLLGLVLLAGVGLLALAARGSGQRPPLAPLLAAVLAGLVLVGAGGAAARRPARAGWWCWGRTGPTGSPSAEADRVLSDPSFVYPDDGRATRLRRGRHPDGLRLPGLRHRGWPSDMHGAVQPVARLFAGLPGVPTRVRMVPMGIGNAAMAARCRSGRRFLRGVGGRAGSSPSRTSSCALG